MLSGLMGPGALSLVVLVIQNSAVVLMTKQSKMQKIPYYTSTLVLNQEAVKLVMCLAIFVFEWRSLREKRLSTSSSIIINNNISSGSGGISSGNGPNGSSSPLVRRPLIKRCVSDMQIFIDELYAQVFQWSTMKLLVPAVLFTVQNYLLFIALSHLDAVTFQMLSQSKLISAAIFSVIMLDKRLLPIQWGALVLLTFGVFLSQYGTSTSSAKAGHLINKNKGDGGSLILGAGACILSGISSSFAGVYFEKVVKSTPPSLAVRNIHLSLFAIPLAAVSMVVLDVIPRWFDGAAPADGAAPVMPPFEFWRGYSGLVYWLVLVHAIGGLLVAVVVKYADNILKGFATAIAIVTSGLYMTVFWDYVPSLWFVGGCGLVCMSTLLYQCFEPKKAVIPKGHRGSSSA